MIIEKNITPDVSNVSVYRMDQVWKLYNLIASIASKWVTAQWKWYILVITLPLQCIWFNLRCLNKVYLYEAIEWNINIYLVDWANIMTCCLCSYLQKHNTLNSFTGGYFSPNLIWVLLLLLLLFITLLHMTLWTKIQEMPS